METKLNFQLQETGQFADKFAAFVTVDGPFALHVEKGIGTVKVCFRTMGTNFVPKHTYYTTVSGVDDDFNIIFVKQVAIVCDTKPTEGYIKTKDA